MRVREEGGGKVERERGKMEEWEGEKEQIRV